MPSLKDLKNRIESVKNTRKITKAMQIALKSLHQHRSDVSFGYCADDAAHVDSLLSRAVSRDTYLLINFEILRAAVALTAPF